MALKEKKGPDTFKKMYPAPFLRDYDAIVAAEFLACQGGSMGQNIQSEIVNDKIKSGNNHPR